MPEGDLLAWFRSLSPFTQVFFGLFLVMVALPIATLIVMQLVDTMRYLARIPGTARKRREADDPGEGR
ncbi:MAG: hypothetical protein RLZZ227_637 [Pseudomonadota bacterium]|jgi:hypothetical protein